MTWKVLQCKHYVENNRKLIFGDHITLSVSHNNVTLIAFQFVVPE